MKILQLNNLEVISIESPGNYELSSSGKIKWYVRNMNILTRTGFINEDTYLIQHLKVGDVLFIENRERIAHDIYLTKV